MRTMDTRNVFDWLKNQGMVSAAEDFSNTFRGMERIDYEGLQAFLFLYYKEFTSDIFMQIRCDVSTNLTIQ